MPPPLTMKPNTPGPAAIAANLEKKPYQHLTPSDNVTKFNIMKNRHTLFARAIGTLRAAIALRAAHARAREAVLALILSWLDAAFARLDALLAQWHTGALPPSAPALRQAKEKSSFCEQKEAKKLHPLAPVPTLRRRFQTRRAFAPPNPIRPHIPRSNGQSFFASFCSQKEESYFPSYILFFPLPYVHFQSRPFHSDIDIKLLPSLTQARIQAKKPYHVLSAQHAKPADPARRARAFSPCDRPKAMPR